MKSCKSFLMLVLLVFSVSFSFAQIDGSNGGNEKGKKKVITAIPAKETEKPTTNEPDSDEGFKKAFGKKQQKEKEENDLRNKGVLSKAQLNDLKIKELYGQQKIEKVDTNLGNFLTLSKTLTISFRDFGTIDGDVISIFHNNIPIIKRITLNEHYQSYQLHLEKGENKIEIRALNQGDVGANTAQYKLINSDGIRIASDYWFLATGARATFIITKNE